MSALQSHLKFELSTLANKTETVSLNLWNMVNAQQESINKNFELLQQNISYLQKELPSKSETIKSLLEVQTVLIELLNKTAVNDCNGIRTQSHLLWKRTLNHLAKCLWVRTPLLSLKVQISRLF